MLARTALLGATGPVIQLWTPDEITTALWLDFADAATVTLSGSNITSVADKGNNAYTFTSTGSVNPTYTAAGQNGLAVMTMGTNTVLQASTTAALWKFLHDGTGSSVYVVGQTTTISSTGCMARTSTGSGPGYLLFFTSSQIRQYIYNASTTPVDNLSTGSPIAASTSFLWATLSDPDAAGGASARSAMHVNGGTAIANNASTQSLSTSDPVTPFSLGGITSAWFNGFICEVVIVSGVQNSTNRQIMEGYLAHKWGLAGSLPGGHPYKSSPPTV